MTAAHRKLWGKLVTTGAATGTLYALLFIFEEQVMANFTRTDGLYPILPVAAALVFSLAHGAFTAYFWEMLGIRPRPRIEALADKAGTD